ncbi:unnamed protein product [Mycena citricolor]|uniref:Uncharacterized protein n=2 Tax=Mycena citricolor TaxID=2018698 RepID=A0AAD2K882_9AGAR|nr:unnamed protein product [Mycena citricolor]
MQAYDFESERLTKGTIRSADDGSRRWTLETTRQTFNGRSKTTIENRAGTLVGTIDWRERVFEIAGSAFGIDVLKRKVSNFSATRYWRWKSGEEYKVRYSNTDDAWQASLATGETVGELKSSITPLFREPSLPVLRLSSTIRDDEERVFMLMLLVYSEMKRLDRQD